MRRRWQANRLGMFFVAALVVLAQPAAAIAHESVTTPDTTATASMLVARHSGKCLDVEGGNPNDRANIIQFTCVPTSPAQRWELVPVGNREGLDYFQLRARHSGKCLDVEGGSPNDRANIIQFTCVPTSPAQHWTFVRFSSGHFLVVARHSGKCLDVEGGSPNDRANIIQFTCVPTSQAQQWSLVS